MNVQWTPGPAKRLVLLAGLVIASVAAGPETNAGDAAPRLTGPANHAALARLQSIELTWDAAPGRQYDLQVVPNDEDAPALDVRVSGSSYTFRAADLEQGPYLMLPGTVYAWRVRASGDDPASTNWSMVWTFSTPGSTAAVIAAREPANGGTATGVAPALEWADKDPHVFWYEVQLSADPAFPPTPSSGNRAVYSNLVHGGASNPLRSWRVPEGSFLEYEQQYHWRVRPVVQGRSPAQWSPVFFFTTPAVPPPPAPEPEPEVEPVDITPIHVGQAPSPAMTAGVGRPTSPAVAPASPAASAAVTSQVGSQGTVLSLINQIRASNGLGTLSSNGHLGAAAQAHSEDMAGRNSMSHTGSNGSDSGARITASGYVWRMYGEIVAAGQMTPEAVVNAWMNSPPHKVVIVSAGLREFGGGLAYSATGRPYWTVKFGSR